MNETKIGPHKYEIINWMDIVSGGDGRCSHCKLPKYMHPNGKLDEWSPARAHGDLSKYKSIAFKKVVAARSQPTQRYTDELPRQR